MSTVDHLASLLADAFHVVLRASWQGALAIVLVLIVRRLLGTRVPARWHYLLWFLVLVRLLAPTSMLPHSPASLENIPAVARPFDRQRLPSADQEAFGKVTVVVLPTLPTLPAPPRVTSPKSPAVAVPAVTRSPWSWQAFVALAWLVGVASLGFWLVACSLSLRRRVHRETVPAEAELSALWQTCCRRWLRRPAPAVLTATWVQSPALVGWWRPTLLLPRQAANSFSVQDWEHVFAHEIAHLRWRDHWTQLLLLAAWSVHWFNPVVWLGLRRLRADRELAADEWVLRHLQNDRALAYGETLFKTLAQRPARLTFQPGMVGISEDGAQMKQRLCRIAAFLPQRRIVGSLVGFAAVLALGTVVLGQSSPAPALTSPPKEAIAHPAATPIAPSVEALVAEARKFSDDLLAAARAGDSMEVGRLLDSSYTPPPEKFSRSAATSMLTALVRQRELKAFTTLYDQLKQTSYSRDWKPDDALLTSLIKEGRTDFLEVLLTRRLDLEPLKALAKSGSEQTTDWIARRVAQVAEQRANVEALEKAAGDGDLPAVQRLVDAGTDIDGVGKDNNTPLLRAVFKDRLEIAQFLLDHGAQVDKARYSVYTPLCLVNSVRMAELLKKNGANVHAERSKGVSILTYVAKFAKADVVAWFLQQGLDPKMVGSNDQNLLCGLKDGQTAKLLLEAGVDPNQVDKLGDTPICWAQSAEVAQALIDHGAKITGFEKPLLPRMIQFGSGRAVEAMFKAQKDPVDHGLIQVSLLDAAFMDRDDTARVLLKNGANPNEPTAWHDQTGDKMLPLMACTINPSPKTAQVLIDAGADPNAGERPGIILQNAIRNGHKDVVAVLRKAGARGLTDLAFAVSMQDKAKVKELLGSAPTYSENPAFWEGALPNAARVGDVDTVRMALDKGVPPKVGQEDAFAEAATEGQDEVVTVLLAARKPGDDFAQLHQAMWDAAWNSHPYESQRTAEHFEKCMRMLLAVGVPINKDNGNLMQAAVFTRNPGGNPIVMEMLARAGFDPNPTTSSEGRPPEHLLDSVQEACAKGQCSVAVAETLVKLNRLATATGGETTPAGWPGPAAPATKSVNASNTQAAVSLSGTVTAAADGRPVSEAKVRLIGKMELVAPNHYGLWTATNGSAATDAQGRFILHGLPPAAVYWLCVEAPGYGAAYVAVDQSTFDALQVKLGPVHSIRGRIIHAPAATLHDGKLSLSFGQLLDEGSPDQQTWTTVKLEPKDGTADFVAGPFYFPQGPYPFSKAPVTLRVDGADKAYFRGEDLPGAGYVLDLAPDPERLAGEYRTASNSPWTLDLRNDGTAFYYIRGHTRYTARYSLTGKIVTFTFPDGLQERLQVEDAQLLGMPENKVLPTFERLKRFGGAPEPASADTENAGGPEKEPSPAASPVPKAKVIEIQATASTEDGAPLGFDEAKIHPSMIFGPSGGHGEQFFPSFNVDGNSSEGHSFMRIPSDASDVGIAVTKEGYAAAFAGPFSPPLEEKLKGLHFTLTKGFNAEVQMVDEAGQPVAGARLKCRYSKPLYLDFVETVTDDQGRATLAHIGAGSLDLLVRADGYQADEVDGIQLDPVKPYRWTLKKAQPLVGYVTASDGQPIVGVKIKLAGVRGPHEETHAGAPYAPVWALADAQGRFVLTSLRPDSRYFFFVDAPGFAGRLLSGIRDTQPELKIVLGPELFIRGKFLHIPTASINAYDNTFVFGYSQFFDIEGKHWATGQQGKVNPKDGEAEFTISALYDNAAVIRAEDKEVDLEAKELPKSGLLIDLTPEITRTTNRPPPTGVVTTLGTPAGH